eukprot:GHVU01164636.1.p1 GENE.GHVU01164636.1~~GHVU01164636.1.p1  ORF type:complete len:1039 (+),score=266.31 GHVU01164636.1:199-3117(+)
MTSVRKPLKFLLPHFVKLHEYYSALADTTPDNARLLADVLSVLAAARASDDTTRQALKLRLAGGMTELVSWGAEYIRSLSGLIGEEYTHRTREEEPMEDLMRLVDEITPFQAEHHGEVEAVDLLAEVERPEEIEKFVDEVSAERVVPYLLQLAQYSPEDGDRLFRVVVSILRKMKDYTGAARVALRLRDGGLLREILDAATAEETAEVAKATRKQIALMVGRQSRDFESLFPEDLSSGDSEELISLAGGELRSKFYLLLAKELDMLKPKSPDDVFKAHLEERRSTHLSSDDTRNQCLARSLVNAFVNAGYGTDSLLTNGERTEATQWLFRNSERDLCVALASLGVIKLWDIERGVHALTDFSHSADPHVKSGLFAGYGLCAANTYNECEPIFGLLAPVLSSSVAEERLGAVLGLAFSHAGTAKPDIQEVLTPILFDGDESVETAAMAALGLGLCFVGTGDAVAAEALIQACIERQGVGNFYPFFALALGLVCLGRKDMVEREILPAVEAAVGGPPGLITTVLLEGCAYAGTGDMLKIQSVLKRCLDVKKEDSSPAATAAAAAAATATGAGGAAAAGGTTAAAAAAGGAGGGGGGGGGGSASERSSRASARAGGGGSTTMGLGGDVAASAANDNATATGADASAASSGGAAGGGSDHSQSAVAASMSVLMLPLIALGDDVGTEMILRMFDHLLQYGDLPVRRAVPVALSLLCTSNPKTTVIETLSKLSHDPDADVALQAIMGLGYVAAGTNNSRAATLLRQLASFYSGDALAMFAVRVAQGLVYMGKGLVSINPIHSDRFLVNHVAVGGLLAAMLGMLGFRSFLSQRQSYLLFFLVPAMQPRMLVTVNEDLEPISVPVRVGQAVDVVAQAGNPKKITGFQTHQSPVLLTYTDRAELATEDYKPVTSVLEGIVILRKVQQKEKDEDMISGSSSKQAAATAPTAPTATTAPTVHDPTSSKEAEKGADASAAEKKT